MGEHLTPRLRLVVVNETLLTTHLLPEAGSVLIGRAVDSNVPIPDNSVSRRHALLHVGETLTLEDLSSSNGTSVNNIRLAPGRPHPVGPSDAIRVGQVLLVLQREWEEPTLARLDPNATVNVLPPRLPERKDLCSSAMGTVCDFMVDGTPVVMRTDVMRRLYAEVSRVAKSSINVLILGETGTGKEILAHAIHEKSPRREKPFLGINCAALTETLLENELFGHEKGAFSGAHETKLGLLEKARGGTVFLDEVGDMSLPIQAKLLRVFEERLVLRLGSVEPRPIDVRIVTATNHDLDAEAAAGRFRKDFYFRLNGVTLHAPPLRERVADIEPLARLIIEGAAAQGDHKSAPELSSEALDLLLRYQWPGNVRELKNVIERAVLLCEEGTIGAAHIRLGATGRPEEQAPKRPSNSATSVKPASANLHGELESLEREKILAAMESCAGNQTRAAQLLGIPRRTLIRKLDLYGIQRPRKS